jgi:succinate dehydrogenase/fumarate reductase flavoprotein subunit
MVSSSSKSSMPSNAKVREMKGRFKRCAALDRTLTGTMNQPVVFLRHLAGMLDLAEIIAVGARARDPGRERVRRERHQDPEEDHDAHQRREGRQVLAFSLRHFLRQVFEVQQGKHRGLLNLSPMQ